MVRNPGGVKSCSTMVRALNRTNTVDGFSKIRSLIGWDAKKSASIWKPFSVPKFPNDLNPQSSGERNSNIEVFADYPITRREINSRKGLVLRQVFKMIQKWAFFWLAERVFENFRSCTGGGYWADDLITGDEYYVTAPNEKCSFSCDSNIFGGNAVLSESYGYWNTITCRGDKGLLDDIDWQHNWRQIPTCVPVES